MSSLEGGGSICGHSNIIKQGQELGCSLCTLHVDPGVGWGWGGLGAVARIAGKREGQCFLGQVGAMEGGTESHQGLETHWV